MPIFQAGDGDSLEPRPAHRFRPSPSPHTPCGTPTRCCCAPRPVDIATIALWLGHASTQTTQIYQHADQALKEQAIARTAPLGAEPGRYRPPDSNRGPPRRAAPAGHQAAGEALGVLGPPGRLPGRQRADCHRLVPGRRRRVLLAPVPAVRVGHRAVLPCRGRLPPPVLRGTHPPRDGPVVLALGRRLPFTTVVTHGWPPARREAYRLRMRPALLTDR
jgi:hypothetical protein